MSDLPRHIAIIMDGNGRWALERGLQRVQGHQAGGETIRRITTAAGEIGIQYLTLYAFSTENWARPKDEVSFLMGLLSAHIDRELSQMLENNIKLRVIGRIQDLPEEIQKKLQNAVKRTEKNTGLGLTLALSYSGRAELVDAVKQIAAKVQDGALKPSEIAAETVSQHLYTAGIPDPDLLIRTSGEFRISNFLLWQLSYTEIYVTEKYWPDFSKEDFVEAIDDYKKRERRFGRTAIHPKK